MDPRRSKTLNKTLGMVYAKKEKKGNYSFKLHFNDQKNNIFEVLKLN